MKRRKFITTTAAGVASVAIAGCTDMGGGDGGDGGGGGGNEQTSPSGTDKNVDANQGGFFEWEEDVNAENALKVQNSRLFRTADGAGVMGDIKNTGNEVFTFVEVQATLYDETDDVLGEFLDNTEESSITRLEPGQVWDFEIFFENADLGKVARYSLSAKGETGNTEETETETPTGNATSTTGTAGNTST